MLDNENFINKNSVNRLYVPNQGFSSSYDEIV
jgi:hypothetical protein